MGSGANGEGKPAKRETYRHGNLRSALLQAGIDLARAAGPDAVTLREATRRVGVAPNAAYRHFADRRALLEGVGSIAQSALADAMETELGLVPIGLDPAETARAKLRAVGTGYVRFAVAEPALFRTAFSTPIDLSMALSPAKAGSGGSTPFQLLAGALDEMAETGAMPREKRAGAEFLAWSAVHGLATLLIEGPLRTGLPVELDDLLTRLLDMVELGLGRLAS